MTVIQWFEGFRELINARTCLFCGTTMVYEKSWRYPSMTVYECPNCFFMIRVRPKEMEEEKQEEREDEV